MKKLLFPIIALTILASCELLNLGDSDDGGNGDYVNCTIIETHVTVPTTWTAERPYLITDRIYVESTLVIQPGTIVKFCSTAGMQTSGDGVILADGTADRKILFTALTDDAGGDNNNDGSNTNPTPGYWDKLHLDGADSRFVHTVFRYGGSDDYAVYLWRNNAQFNACEFRDNRGGLDIGHGGAASTVTNTLFVNNGYTATSEYYGKPLWIGTAMDMDVTNRFSEVVGTGADAVTVTNKYQQIGVWGGSIDRAVTWAETEVAFVMEEDLALHETLTLTGTPEDPVILKFRSNCGLTIHNDGESGALAGANYLFTAYTDDSHGGDANGDGSTTQPTPSYWDGIYVYSTDSYDSTGTLYAANEDL